MTHFLGCLALMTALVVAHANVMDDIFKQNHMFPDENPKEEVDGLKLFEGDLLLTDEKKMEIEAMRAGHEPMFDVRQSGKWPGKTVPYTFRSGGGTLSATEKLIIVRAMGQFMQQTCVKFKPRTNEQSYVEFFKGGGCYSYLGRIGGKQPISIGRGCAITGIVIHEIMHAIGFYHEQARLDRDRYITINLNNVRPQYHRQFSKYAPGAASTLGEPYDKQSVMHYGRSAFAINRAIPVITSKSNPNEELGQRNGFSKIDLNQIRKHYDCAAPTLPPTQPPVTKPPTRPPTKPPGTKCTRGGLTSRDKWAFCRRLDNFCKSHYEVRENCCRTCRFRAGIIPPK